MDILYIVSHQQLGCSCGGGGGGCIIIDRILHIQQGATSIIIDHRLAAACIRS